MRIGIDCRQIWNPEQGEGAGVGQYIFFLLKNLAKIDQQNEYFLFFRKGYNTNQLTFLPPNFHVMVWGSANGKMFTKFVQQFMWRKKIKKLKLNVFHSPAYTLPWWYTGKSVITVHDLAIYQHPEWFPELQWLSTKILVPRSIKKATHIITVSHATQREIEERFHIPAERINVIYEGVGDKEVSNNSFETACRDLSKECAPVLLERIKDQPYVLSINTLEPRKNIPRLIQAFERVQGSRAEPLHLVLAGGLGWKYQEIFRIIENSPYKRRIHYVGYVTQEEKYTLLRHAVVFACISLAEGFGLGNLEAMLCGTPVVASDIPVFREVLGNAACFVNPYDVEGVTERIQTILSDTKLRTQYQQLGKKRAQEFNWKHCAEQTLQTYELCLQ